MDVDLTLGILRDRITFFSDDLRQRFLIPSPHELPWFERNHRPVEEMGSGSHGSVWKTLDQYSGDFIAVKVLKRHMAPDDPRWKPIESRTKYRECTLVSYLNHVSSCQIILTQNQTNVITNNWCFSLTSYRALGRKGGNANQSKTQSLSKYSCLYREAPWTSWYRASLIHPNILS